MTNSATDAYSIKIRAHTYGSTHTYWLSWKGGNGRVWPDRHMTTDPTDAVALTPDSPTTCIPPGAHRDTTSGVFLPILHPATTPTNSPFWVGRRHH